MKPKYSKQRKEENQKSLEVYTYETGRRRRSEHKRFETFDRENEHTSSDSSSEHEQRREHRKGSTRHSKEHVRMFSHTDIKFLEEGKNICRSTFPTHKESSRRQKEASNQARYLKMPAEAGETDRHVNTDQSHESKGAETSTERGNRIARVKQNPRADDHIREVDTAYTGHEEKHVEYVRPKKQKGNITRKTDYLKAKDNSEVQVKRRNDLQPKDSLYLQDYNDILQKKEISETSSTLFADRHISILFKTLVQIKAENLPLEDVAKIVKDHLHVEVDWDDSDVFLSVLEQHDDKIAIVFGPTGPLISPKTDVAICPIFTNDTSKGHDCNDLHICKYFLLCKCSRNPCKFGHNLSTKHNKRVFQQHGLAGLEKDSKITLIRSMASRNFSTLPLICKFYNNEGKCSKGNKCLHLHICKYFINKDCKFGKKCKRSHNILAKQPMTVFKKYGITPDRYNSMQITNLIRDSLEESGVQMRREVQSSRRSALQASGYDKPVISVENDRFSASDNEWTDSEHFDPASLDSSCSSESESDDREFRETSAVGTEINIFNESLSEGTEQASGHEPRNQANTTRQKDMKGSEGEVSNCGNRRRSCSASKSPVHQQDEITPIMTFESQFENKIFRIRTMNGQRWQIAGMSGNWTDLEEQETRQLVQFHNEFIHFAEKAVSKPEV